MKHTTKDWAISLFLLTIASFLRAFGTHCFVLPNDFAPGGFTAVSVLIEYATGFSSGYSYFIINVPIVVFAFLYLNKPLAFKTTYVITLNSAFLVLFREINLFTYSPEEKLLAAITGGCFLGISLALALKVGGSFGGTDIFGIAIQRKLSATNVAYFIFMLDAAAVVVSFFVYSSGLTPIILAVSTMFVQSKLCDMIAYGTQSAIRVDVVTKKPEELSQAIIQTLHRGVTKMDAVGMYTHEQKNVIVCVIRRRQLSAFRKLLKEIDPEAFAHISHATEVVGKGFRSAG